ncbi:DMT family transporter [Entomobacter blattae]|uniref:EamA-like transporter family protein n=1 Tax=Entomobacter blattae TaxID=2762277 RepID=A0A7H1NUK8_9PROT|nr:DMT family transporter [Entomobacter blattae]QNT79468.1 EamA-like transporter family protein [Entomobacter blattae]
MSTHSSLYHSQRSYPLLAVGVAAGCAIVWSFLAVVAKKAQLYVDSFQFLFFSNSLSLLSLAIIAFFSKTPWHITLFPPLKTLKHAAILGTLDGLFYLLIYKGYSLENGVAVLAAQYCWPLLIVFLSSLIFRYKPHIIQVFSLILGFCALLLVFFKTAHTPTLPLSENHHWLGIILVLAGAFCFALLSVLSRYFFFSPVGGTFWLFMFSTFCSALLLVMFGKLSWPPLQAWLPIAINGLVINGPSYVLWIWAMRHGDAAKISSMTFLAPILSVIWLVFLTGEPFVPLYAIALAGIVGAGIVCFSFSHKKTSR